MQRGQKGFLAVLGRQNRKALGGISESHGELRRGRETGDGADLAISDAEMAANSVVGLYLEEQFLSFDILGAGRVLFDRSLQQPGQGPQQEFELQHGGWLSVNGSCASRIRATRRETGWRAARTAPGTGIEPRGRHPGR